MTEPDLRDRLGSAAAADLLGLTKAAFWYRYAKRAMAESDGREDGAPYWFPDTLHKWAGRSGELRFRRRSPVRYWPAASARARYLGAVEEPDYVAQSWKTESGVIAVVWPLRLRRPRAEEVAQRLPQADALIRVASDFGRDGPALGTAQPGARDVAWSDFLVRWNDLSRVLGLPAPYWPLELRVADLILEWRPGNRPVVYPATPPVDVTPLLVLDLALPADSAAHTAVRWLASVFQYGAMVGANDQVDLLRRLQRARKSDLARTTAIAARPTAFPEPGNLTDTVLSAGWSEIMKRTDRLAAQCVTLASAYDGGKHFTHAGVAHVDPMTRYGAEWAKRLRAPAERAAIYESLSSRIDAVLFDPVSEAPVVREPDGRLVVAVPQRLTDAGGRLSQVVLDEPIWIRTEDGTLQPAPLHHYYGISWGYSGSGPGALALLIHRLLDDIAAPAADSAGGAPPGLDELTELSWPRETVLSRELLEAARSGRPYKRPVRKDDVE